MRTLIKLVAGAAAAATVTALAVAPAMADPPAHVTPHPQDVVGVGSDTIEFLLDQFSVDFNQGLPKSAPHLYSYDATGSVNIPLKSGCKAIARPDGSSAGIASLVSEEGATTGGHPCLDFARSSRNREPTDPAYAKGGISFVALAGDAVTYATEPGSDAPSNLTTAQLDAIYTCKDTNWKQVGGKSGAIHPFLPQTGSGTRSFFLTAVGSGTAITPGPCVSWGQTSSNPVGTIQENEGVNNLFKSDAKGLIFPYSVGKYIAQVYHSPACAKADCAPANTGLNAPACKKPAKGQNAFGCDEHGTFILNDINGTSPFKKGSKPPVLNPHFTALFSRTVYIVVPYPKTDEQNGIPDYLLSFFGPQGYTCTNATAKDAIADYGFQVYPAGTKKGHSTTKCGDAH
jgi:ABC-type phosphate transport system substrate-binding protein